VKRQSGQRRCPGPAEEDFLLQVEGPLCSNVGSESRRPHAQLSGAALVDGGCQTHHRAVVSACLVLTPSRCVYISWFFYRNFLVDFVYPLLLFKVQEIHLKGVELE